MRTARESKKLTNLSESSERAAGCRGKPSGTRATGMTDEVRSFKRSGRVFSEVDTDTGSTPTE